MSLRPFIAIPTNLREWSRYLSEVDVTPSAATVKTTSLVDGVVTLPKLATDVVATLAAKVPSTRAVNAGAGLTGGGALNADVTLALDPIPALALLGRLDAFKSADTTITSSTTLTADPHLAVMVALGTYDFEAFLAFYEVTLGTGGFQFDLAAGSASIGSILWGADGYATAAVANPAAVSATTAQTYATIATSAAAPSWVRVSGQVTFGAPGTFGVRWAQNASSANGTTLKAKSDFTLQKVA